MLSKVMSTARFVYDNLEALPPYVEDKGPDAWAKSFALRRKASRRILGEAIVRSGDGVYKGEIGNHALAMHGITVIGMHNAYEQLLSAWLNAARGQAGAA